MKFHPILFSTPMVQAIIQGNKTQTRRVVKPQPKPIPETPTPVTDFVKKLDDYSEKGLKSIHTSGAGKGLCFPNCPYGQVGDVLWVRESFVSGIEMYDGSYVYDEHGDYKYKTWYKADNDLDNWYPDNSDFPEDKIPWKPGIHMPKEACRLFLKITDIRVEQLQSISRGDAMAEGCPFPNIARQTEPKLWFQELWISINGKESWYENPWVWVISFERIEKPENFI